MQIPVEQTIACRQFEQRKWKLAAASWFNRVTEGDSL